MNAVVLPAVMPTGYALLAQQVTFFEPVCPWIHIDVMDGVFTEQRSWPYTEASSSELALDSVRLPQSNSQYEVHLMVQEPQHIGSIFARAGADRIIAHAEAFVSLESAHTCMQKWRAFGVHTGLAFRLETSLEEYRELLGSGLVDSVLIMSIPKIGVQGSGFDMRALERIDSIRTEHPTLGVGVDGGIRTEHVALLQAHGVERLCVGSAILSADDPVEAYRLFLRTA